VKSAIKVGDVVKTKHGQRIGLVESVSFSRRQPSIKMCRVLWSGSNRARFTCAEPSDMLVVISRG
jgi:hypothetical protein